MTMTLPEVTRPMTRPTPTTPRTRPWNTWHAQANGIHAAWERQQLTDGQARTQFLDLLERARVDGARWALLGLLRSFRAHVHARGKAKTDKQAQQQRKTQLTRRAREVQRARHHTPGPVAGLHLHQPSTALKDTTTPAAGHTILYAPAPGAGTIPDVTPAPTPRRSRHERTLRRSAVHHLARMLYVVHARGWQSLSLTLSTSTPSGTLRPLSTGGFTYRTYAPFDGVTLTIDTLITTHAYQQALAALDETQQAEIRGYYRRKEPLGDVCPNLEHSHYTSTFQAFAELLDTLFAQGALQ